ncbi:hypothetical protein WAF17_16720 [Bernardetia sp. ABR2-2B]|uniref:hypothetical protein n=1 Tax=Bernardetia sp. ABR2-2B TaxID=3127472 RepID=UPI0030CD2A8D
MESTTRDIIKERIRSKKEIHFQGFVNFLYTKCYGSTRFTTIKQKRDGGSDGVLDGNTILAVYGPNQLDLNKFKKKLGKSGNAKEPGDFEKYEKNFSDKYPNWQVVYNNEMTTSRVEYLRELKSDVILVGVDDLVELISVQNYADIEAIGKWLEIKNSLISNDLLYEVVIGMLRLEEDTSVQISSFIESAIDPQEKIEINFSGEEIDRVTEELIDGMKYFGALDTMFKGKSDKVNILKKKVRDALEDYNDTLYNSLKKYEKRAAETSNKTSDDKYKYYLRCVLLYLFERCYIGKKTLAEKKKNALSK